ncbi:MucR family transcriptional regulator [Alphaproteobacteria bacterium]|nr:MucR family transcriptional regulator [Alphaproteobacteria bacterium]
MAEENDQTLNSTDLLRMSVEIVSAYVGNNSIAVTQVPDVISTVYGALTSLSDQTVGESPEPQKPAVSVRRSVNPDHIICLEDGKKLKMLKRHLRAAYGMTPDEYRAKWGLPVDYPMVAPNYALRRSVFAKEIGLGRKKGEKIPRRKK